MLAELRSRGINTREKEEALTDQEWAEIAAAAGCPSPPLKLIEDERSEKATRNRTN